MSRLRGTRSGATDVAVALAGEVVTVEPPVTVAETAVAVAHPVASLQVVAVEPPVAVAEAVAVPVDAVAGASVAGASWSDMAVSAR